MHPHTHMKVNYTNEKMHVSETRCISSTIGHETLLLFFIFYFPRLQFPKFNEHHTIFKKIYMASFQGSQYRTDTGRYVPYWYIFQYRNINVLYWFKYWPNWPCTGHTGQFRVILNGIGCIGRYRKKKIYIYIYIFFFLSFVIFEFLLG